MGNACMRKKKPKLEIKDNTIKTDYTKNKPTTNILITSTPPIETPDMSVYMQTVNNQTPKSEYSRKSSARLNPIRKNFDSNIDNGSFMEYSFVKNDSSKFLNEQVSQSFKVYGVSKSKEKSEIIRSLQNQSIPSFDSNLQNDLLLITEENMEILNFLSQNNISGPYYFDDVHHSKIDLNSSTQKYITKQTPSSQSNLIPNLRKTC